MIEHLTQLKERATKLRYSDRQELDDILRKSRMIIEKIFPNKKISYQAEINLISFIPIESFPGMGHIIAEEAWNVGAKQLINLLDTRIQEYELENKIKESKIKRIQPKEIIVEKIVKVEDIERISKLIQENEKLKKSGVLYKWINWGMVSIVLTIIGGAFGLGMYFGFNRFDKEKIDLLDNNKILMLKNDSLIKINSIKDYELLKLKNSVKESRIKQE